MLITRSAVALVVQAIKHASINDVKKLTNEGIAKLTFRHDRNTIIHGIKLLLPFSKTQKRFISNPDNGMLKLNDDVCSHNFLVGFWSLCSGKNQENLKIKTIEMA